MSRIPPLNRTDFDAALSERTVQMADEQLGSTRVFAHVPGLAAAWLDFLGTMRAGEVLDPRLKELVRLRIAFHNQCPRCMSMRLEPDAIDEAVVCTLDVPEEPPGLTDLERAALRFADLMARDHLAIDDAVFDELRRWLSVPEVVELAMQVAVFVGFGRLGAVLRVVDDLPEQYAAEGPLRYT